MKKNIYSFFMLTCLLNLTAFAQTIDYHPYCNWPVGCEARFTIYTYTGALPETGGIISVDWGDGNTTTQNYTTTSGQDSYSIDISHGYAIGGVYPVSFNVYSGTAGANVDSGQDTVITAPGSSNCAYVDVNTYKPATSSWLFNVPYQFTDVNNNVMILTGYGGSSTFIGINPANAPYTIQIDPNWLVANNLIQTSPVITVNSFDPSGASSGSPYYVVNVSCDDPNTDFGISYGWASQFNAVLQSGHLILKFCNYSCGSTSTASVSIQIPANFTPNTSGLTNAVISGNTLTFDIPSFTGCRTFYIPFSILGSSPAGTPFCFNVAINGPNDNDLSNNYDTICGVITNSYDPNDKTVDLATNINPDEVDQLRYIIRFQNDGNANAAKVVIRDSISPNLDLSTFQYLGAKHYVATSIDPTTRIVTFTFDNINLGQSAVDLDASQGYVVYSISELPNLPVGTEIENTAYIYFDFNPAIVTNTTYNINQTTLGLSGNSIEQIGMYPNPAKDKLQFSGASVKEITVYDLTGKVVLTARDLDSNEISLSTIQTGIYQVVLKTETGSSTQKLVIQK